MQKAFYVVNSTPLFWVALRVGLSFLNPWKIRNLIQKAEKEKRKKVIRRPRGDRKREVKK